MRDENKQQSESESRKEQRSIGMYPSEWAELERAAAAQREKVSTTARRLLLTQLGLIGGDE